MPRFDLFTLLTVSVVNILLAAAALALVARLNRGCGGIKRCAGACVLIVLGFGFYPFRAAHPGIPAILLTNFPLFAAGLLLLDGIRGFRGFARPVRSYLAVSTLYVGGFCWFLFVTDNPSARSAVGAFFVAGVTLAAAEAMARNVPRADRPVYWITAAGFALHGLSLLARGVVAMTGPAPVFMQSQPIDVINLVTLNVTALACAFGFSMATNLQLQRQTEQLALYDPLTRLPNRRFFEERLEEAERKALERNERIALIYCDLDDFKNINDTVGHEGGDQALRTVAERLRTVAGRDGCLARIGGDEFVLLIETAPPRESLEALMVRLRNGVAGDIRFGGRVATLQISCGLAVYPEDVGSTSDLIRLADAGMYMMKQRGRFPASPQVVAGGL